MSWQHRQPFVKVSFLTKKGSLTIGTEFDNIKDIVSVNVSNRMNQAAGNFQINLTARPIANGLTYADIITPLDMVEIQLGSRQTLMMGLVDGVSERTSVSRGGVRRRILIAGRAMGSVFTFDNVKYWRGIDVSSLPDDLKKRASVILKGATEEGFWGRDAVEAVRTIVEVFRTVEQEYNQNTEDETVPTFALYDRINYEDELVTMKDRLIFNSGLMKFEGDIWQYLKQCIIPPFEELWTDSRDGKCFLRMRPAPFDMEEQALSDGSNGGWDHTSTWLDDDKPFHDITPPDIVSRNLTKSHTEAASWFDIIPSRIPFVSNYLKNAYFPPLINPDLVHTLGARGLTFSVNLLPITEDRGLSQEEAGKSFHDWFVETRMKAYLWYKDNHRYKTGSITTKGNADYRVGDRVRLHNRKGKTITAYLEGIRTSYRWGSPLTSTLSLTRGASEEDRRKWWDEGKDWARQQVVAKAEKQAKEALDKVPQEVVNAINEVLDAIAAIEYTNDNGVTQKPYTDFGTDSAKVLMAATAAAESGGFQYKEQKLREGSTLPDSHRGYSYWQVTPITAIDNYQHNLLFNSPKYILLDEKIQQLAGILSPLWRDLNDDNKWDKVPIAKSLLLDNINFACAMAATWYIRRDSGIPQIDDLTIDVKDEMAKYWGDTYNTEPTEEKLANFKDYWDIYKFI